MKYKFTVYNDPEDADEDDLNADGEQHEHELPGKNIVCPACDGRGTRVSGRP